MTHLMRQFSGLGVEVTTDDDEVSVRGQQPPPHRLAQLQGLAHPVRQELSQMIIFSCVWILKVSHRLRGTESGSG